MQEKLGRGEFSRSGSVRVLHLRMNPESEYQKQVRIYGCVQACVILLLRVLKIQEGIRHQAHEQRTGSCWEYKRKQRKRWKGVDAHTHTHMYAHTGTHMHALAAVAARIS